MVAWAATRHALAMDGRLDVRSAEGPGWPTNRRRLFHGRRSWHHGGGPEL